MEKSQSIVEITKALIAFHEEVPVIEKTADNPFFKSKYADLADIIRVVEPVLSKHKLAFVQMPTGVYGLTTIIMHQSGEYIQGEFSVTPAKDDPQGAGSAITYMRRYALASALGLKIDDEDDDGNVASGNTANTAGRHPAAVAKSAGKTEKISDAQRKYLFQIIRHVGKTKEDFEAMILTQYKVNGIENLPKRTASTIIDGLVKKYGAPKRATKPSENDEDLPVAPDPDESDDTSASDAE